MSEVACDEREIMFNSGQADEQIEIANQLTTPSQLPSHPGKSLEDCLTEWNKVHPA